MPRRDELDPALRQLRAQGEQLFRTIFEGAAVGMATGLPDGRLLQVNPRFCRMLGYPRDELLDKTVDEITHSDDREISRRALEATAARGRRATEYEKRYLHRDGRIVWGHVTSVMLYDDDGEPICIVGMIQDITERRKNQELLRRAQRMEAIGQLAGGVAHDFNNLMTAITGYSDFLRRRLDEGDPRRREVSQIADAARQAAALTEQLLAISHQQVLQSTLIEGQQLVASLCSGMRWLLGDDIHMRFELDAGSARILVDADRLEKALQCLIDNARDAMPTGGTLTVGTSIRNAADVAAATRESVGDGSYLVISVRDDGCGIAQHDQAHVFEPFFTTKQRDRGTGLGLATVYGMVRQTGGHLWVESEPGAGSDFCLAFPLREETADSAETAAAVEDPRGPGKAATVFLVEDDDSIRELCREILEMDGHEVIEAVDGVQALEILDRLDREIDIVMTDVVMPRMGGPELVQRMSVDRPGLKVIFTSGYTHGAITDRDDLPEGCSFVGKPFAPDELSRAVREALDR